MLSSFKDGVQDFLLIRRGLLGKLHCLHLDCVLSLQSPGLHSGLNSESCHSVFAAAFRKLSLPCEMERTLCAMWEEICRLRPELPEFGFEVSREEKKES